MKFIIIFLILGIFGYIFLGYQHELVHQQIFKAYDINSSIHLLKYFPDFRTTADEGCTDDTCQLAHMQNEIFGYQIDAIYLVLFFMGASIIGILELYTDYKLKLLENIEFQALKMHENELNQELNS